MASLLEAPATAADSTSGWWRERTPARSGLDPSPPSRLLVTALTALALAALAAASAGLSVVDASPLIGRRRLLSGDEGVHEEMNEIKIYLREIEKNLLNETDKLTNDGKDKRLKMVAGEVLEELNNAGEEDDDPQKLAFHLFEMVEEQLVFLEAPDGEFLLREKEGLTRMLQYLLGPAFPTLCSVQCYLKDRPGYYKNLQDAEKKTLDRYREWWNAMASEDCACGEGGGTEAEGNDSANEKVVGKLELVTNEVLRPDSGEDEGESHSYITSSLVIVAIAASIATAVKTSRLAVYWRVRLLAIVRSAYEKGR